MLKSMRLAERTKHVTTAEMMYGLAYVAINKKAGDALPADVQKVMNELGEFGQATTIEYQDASEKESIDYAKSLGAQVVKIDKAELAKLHAAARPVFEKRAADLEGRGKAGKKVLALVEKLSQK
jgi:TRAP-type C4-dicarboxylate transport system substrate-binding protein